MNGRTVVPVNQVNDSYNIFLAFSISLAVLIVLLKFTAGIRQLSSEITIQT